MRSPWLDIALADYEGHMALPGIGQAEMLADQFAQLLGECTPASVAVIGCAGGNGFDRIDTSATRRVVGIDINARYLEALRHRYGATIPGLELHACDIQAPIIGIQPVDLIYAALVLEYVDPVAALHTFRSLCRPKGILATVLQLPSEGTGAISASPFARLKALAPAMRLLSPDTLTHSAADQGFLLRSARTIRLPSGKEFALQTLQRVLDAGL